MAFQLTLFRYPQACIVAVLCVVCFAASADSQEGQEGASIENARLVLERWVDVRRAISNEKSDWALGKQILEDRIELLQRYITEVEGQIVEQKQKLWGFDEKVHQLEKQNNKLKQNASELEKLVAQMEKRTVELLQAAPRPLVEDVKPLAVQIPGYGTRQDTQPSQKNAGQKNASETSDSLDEKEKNAPPLARRVENVVGVLYLFNKYAGKVDQVSELVSRPDGSSLSVDAVYLGTSYGFYVDDSDAIAASGRPGSEGWTWSDINAAVLDVRRVIQVINDDQPAAFVGLPVEVQP